MEPLVKKNINALTPTATSTNAAATIPKPTTGTTPSTATSSTNTTPPTATSTDAAATISKPTSTNTLPLVATASAKLLLSGEHAVLLGVPAAGIPLPLSLTVRLIPSTAFSLHPAPGNEHALSAYPRFAVVLRRMLRCYGAQNSRIVIDSNIPISSGLGSSAALCVACAHIILTLRNRATGSTRTPVIRPVRKPPPHSRVPHCKEAPRPPYATKMPTQRTQNGKYTNTTMQANTTAHTTTSQHINTTARTTTTAHTTTSQHINTTAHTTTSQHTNTTAHTHPMHITAAGMQIALTKYGRALWRIAHTLERCFHGTPSGVDTAIIALNTPLLLFHRWRPSTYQRHTATRSSHRTRLRIRTRLRTAAACRIPHMRYRCISHTLHGAFMIIVLPRHTPAKGMIRTIGTARSRPAMRLFCRKSAELVRRLIDPPSSIGTLIHELHSLQIKLDLSTAEIDACIAHAIRCGAISGKVSGAGGGGGAFILFPHIDILLQACAKMHRFCRNRYPTYYLYWGECVGGYWKQFARIQ